MKPEQKILEQLRDTLKAMRKVKPVKDSEAARYYAVTITEMEKLIAYFIVYVAV